MSPDVYILHIMNCFGVVYLTEGIGLDQDDCIFTGRRKKDLRPTNNPLLQSSIIGSIKILHTFSFMCLGILRRGEITVIQMLSDFNTPVNIRKEITTPSSAIHGKKAEDETSVLNILSTYLCSISSQAITSAESRLLDTYITRSVSVFIKT